MSVEQAIVRMNPSRQLYAAEAEARLQEAKRVNKMKAVCSSHQTSGSAVTPIDGPKQDRQN